MSRGTIIRLLKKANYSLCKDDLERRVNTYIENSKAEFNELVEYKLDKNRPICVPRFLFDGNDADVCDCIDTKTGKGYFTALEYRYNSCFGEVRNSLLDFYGVGGSQTNPTIVVPYGDIKEMLLAVDYLLLEKFDKDFERIMDNGFVEIFGTLSAEYQYTKYKEKFPNDTDTNIGEYDDFRSILLELKTVLSAYSQAEVKDDYALTFHFWG